MVELVDARYTSQKCCVCKTIDKASRKGNRYVCRHCGNAMHEDVNADINIRDNYITRVLQSGQAAVNQPYGECATGKACNGVCGQNAQLVLKVVDLEYILVTEIAEIWSLLTVCI